MVVRPRDQAIYVKYLEYFFRGGLDLSNVISGAAQPQITRRSLSPTKIRYPASLTEQRRIVAVLDEAFDGIANVTSNAKKNLQNSRELFESYLNAVFISARRKEGLEELRVEIERTLFGRNLEVEVKIRAVDGRGIARVKSLLLDPTSCSMENGFCVLRGLIHTRRMSSLENVSGAHVRYVF